MKQRTVTIKLSTLESSDLELTQKIQYSIREATSMEERMFHRTSRLLAKRDPLY